MSKAEFNDSQPPSDFKAHRAWEIHETRPKKIHNLMPTTPPTAEPNPNYVKLDGTARYLVEDAPNLGTGGMSGVHKGWDRKLAKFVAIKTLDRSWVMDSEFENMIELEAKTLTRISHPGIPEVYDLIFTADGDGNKVGIMIMQYIDGKDLRSWMELEQPFGLGDLTRVIDQTASTVDYMNSHGIFHRDIKPGNIMFTEPHIKIVDFGSSNWASKTVAVTPGYFAPEIYKDTMDPRTDEYSLAATAYVLLSGELFLNTSDNIKSVAETIKIGMRTAKAKYQLSDGQCSKLIAVLKMGLAYNPNDRFQTSGKFAEAFCEAF